MFRNILIKKIVRGIIHGVCDLCVCSTNFLFATEPETSNFSTENIDYMRLSRWPNGEAAKVVHTAACAAALFSGRPPKIPTDTYEQTYIYTILFSALLITLYNVTVLLSVSLSLMTVIVNKSLLNFFDKPLYS